MSRQNLALWALIILPLLVSVVANLVKAGPIGVACSLGAAAFAAVVSDVSSAVLRERAAEVTATDEKELRRVAMGDDLFDTAPSSPSARSVPLPSAAASPLGGLREDELVALGADAARVRSYLNRFGLDVPVTEISQALAGTPRLAAPVVRSPRAVQVQQPVPQQVQVPQVKPEPEPELQPEPELEPESELEPAGPAEPEPHVEPEREPGGDQRNDVSKRAAAKEAQVREVVALIRARGYENVSLAVVQDKLGLARTTAYNRLVEARARVNRAAS